MKNVMIMEGDTVLGRYMTEYLGRRCFVTHPLDEEKRKSLPDTLRRIHEETGGPYALLHGTGIGLRGFFEDLSENEMREVLEANVFQTMQATREVIPYMRSEKKGRIVFISSISGRIASPASSAYSACKFAIEGFAESLSQELLPFGINVVLVEPGITREIFWDVHNRVAAASGSTLSPYSDWFQGIDEASHRLVANAPTRLEDVAGAIHRALTADKPRLRYMVGRRARLVYLFRRLLPEPLFDRIYFGGVVRRVTAGRNTKG